MGASRLRLAVRQTSVKNRREPDRDLDSRATSVVTIRWTGFGQSSGRGAVWLARLNGVQEVAGSNPVAPTSQGLSGQRVLTALVFARKSGCRKLCRKPLGSA